MSKLAIFDLDNTLNSTIHRQHLIPDDPTLNQNWLPWHKAFNLESANLPLIKTLERLREDKWKIIVCSNRCESLIGETEKWFKGIHTYSRIDEYILRSPYDHTPPTEWKARAIGDLFRLSTPAVTLIFDGDLEALDSVSYINGVVPIPVYFNG